MRWFAVLAVLLLVARGGGDDDDADAGETDGTPSQPTSTSAMATTTAGSTPSSSEPTQDANGALPDVHAPLAAGSSAEVDSDNPDPFAAEEEMEPVKVSILNILDPAETDSPIFQPQAGNKYWAVEVTMGAIGSKRVNTGEWTLRTTDGLEYETSVMTGVGDDITYGPIEPSESLQGVLVFEIPLDATIDYLHMSPSIYVGGNLVFDAR